MIRIELSRDDFSYDVSSLVKAFYPMEDLKVVNEGETDIVIKVDYQDECILISHIVNGTTDEEKSENVDYTHRADTKNKLKRTLYRLLNRQTKTILPWGTLTGIRPVMLPMAFLEQGENPSKVCEIIKDKYYISDDKANLALEVALKEIELLKDIDYENGYSLYIGIPFCPTTCLYCSFTSYSIEKFSSYTKAYLDALEMELKYVISMKKRMPDTVYVGGGTPTSLCENDLKRLLQIITENVDLSKVLEFTVEAGRPDSLTRGKLELLKEYNVGRISINPQTMNQKTLDFIDRKHTVMDVIDKYNMAREVGLDNINMDIIVGLPGEDLADLTHTLEEIQKLKPDSFTVHALALKRASNLNINRESYNKYMMDISNETMKLTREYAKDMGMLPYYLYRQKNMTGNMENVGYSMPGKECLYNILIMEEKQDIIAIGAGASTKKISRTGEKTLHEFNVKDVKGYIENIQKMIDRKKEFFSI